MISLGIIGGGRGGSHILNLIEGMRDIRIEWIADLDEQAPALQRARRKGIRTITNFIPEVNDESLELVIEVTGNDKVAALLNTHKHERLSTIDATGARLLVGMVQEREQMLEQLAEKSRQLNDSMTTLEESAVHIDHAMKNLSAEADTLTDNVENLNAATKAANQSVNDTYKILELIENVARTTNMIGLNAAIEAARVGETGRGFAVVAEEISKLAKSTTESVRKINDNVKHIVQSMDTIHKDVESVGEATHKQVKAKDEVLDSLNALTSIAATMKTISEDLIQLQR